MRTLLQFILKWTVIGLALAFLVVLWHPDWLRPQPSIGSATQSSSVSNTGYADAVARTAPAVVNIVTERLLSKPQRGNSPEDAKGSALQQSLGSGVIVDDQGHIITANHVVACAQSIRVQLADGRTAIADLVGSDPATDLALLRIVIDQIPSAPLGSSERLRPGDIVLAIGAPYGLSQTVTQGIISATGRGQLQLADIESYIQTDAAINEGSSGGALIDIHGEVIGINTAALSQGLGNSGISFAVPINLARGVMKAILSDGRVIRGWFGVDTETLTAEDAAASGLSDTTSLRIKSITPGSPAAQTGLLKGDIILAINGRPRTWDEALRVVADTAPGRTINVIALHQGRQQSYSVTLVERPDTSSNCASAK